MDLKNLVYKIENGTIEQSELLELVQNKMLLETYNNIPIIDYILRYKRNNDSFDKIAIYNKDVKSYYIKHIIIDSLNINLPKKQQEIIKQRYAKEYYKKYYEHPINDQSFLKMLDKFRDIMLIDGKSSIEAVELACNSFEILFASNNQYAYRDLESLINIKEQNPDFKIRITDELSKAVGITNNCFSPLNNCIFLKGPYNIADFNHELTHAIHHYYNNQEEPIEFNLFSNPTEESKEKMVSFCKKIFDCFLEYRKLEKLKNRDKGSREILLCLDDETLLNYYNKCKEKYFEILQIQNISGGDAIYSISPIDFKTTLEKSATLAKTAQKFFVDFEPELALEDMFDAVTRGVLKDNVNSTRMLAGNGKEYFLSNDKRCFGEILANYGMIIKSQKKDQLMPVLIDVMGKDFVDMLDNFYDKMYIKGKEQNLSEGKHKL